MWDNEQTITVLLKQTNRKHIDIVLEWMKSNHFFEAPASIKHHNNFLGGLAQHSLDVYNEAVRLNKAIDEPLPCDSVTICSLLHDVCKSDVYCVDSQGKLRKNHENEAKGHGIRSIQILKSCELPLSREEELAIWWHMGEYEHGANQSIDYLLSQNIPLCNLIRRADHNAAINGKRM